MKTSSRVYDSYAQAEHVVKDLETADFPSSDISLVANKHVSDQYANVDNVSEAGSGAAMGAVVGGGAGLLTGLGLLAIPGLGPVVAAGWLATTALGAVAGAATGGIIGALIDGGETEDTAHVYSEAVRRGGTLVTVRSADSEVATVQEILDRQNPIDPDARQAEYRSGGWNGFDPDAPAYTPTNSDVERNRRGDRT